MELKKKPAIYLFSGKPASGKSFCLKSIIYDFQKGSEPYFKFIKCFVRTKFNDDYSYLPDEYVDDKYTDDKLLTHIEKLREYRRKTNKPCPPNAVILDDLMSVLDLTRSELSNWLATYRHTNTSVFLTTQYMLNRTASTALREMVSYSFLWNTKFKNSLKGYYEAFAQLYDSYEDFVEDFQNKTKVKYQCVVYDSSVDELEDNYTTYLAPSTVPEFKLMYKF